MLLWLRCAKVGITFLYPKLPRTDFTALPHFLVLRKAEITFFKRYKKIDSLPLGSLAPLTSHVNNVEFMLFFVLLDFKLEF